MTRILRFAGSAVRVIAEGEPAQQIVKFLYDRVVDVGEAEPHVTLTLSQHAAGRFVLRRDGEMVAERDERGAAAEALLGESLYHLVDRSQGGIMLHAAAVSLDGRSAVVMPGTSGAGKTTLTAWLLARGARYLTDELVWLPEGHDEAHAFTRPLNLKLGSRPALDSLLRDEGRQHVWSWQGGDFVDPAAFDAGVTLAHARIAVLVFPSFERGAAFELTPLTKGQTGQTLLGFVANARSLARHGLGEVSRVARAVPAYRLSYGHFEQLDELARFLHAVMSDEKPGL